MGDERQWYVDVRGEKKGPMSSVGLRELAKAGEIDRSSLVWVDGMPDWVEAGAVKGLFQGPPPVRQVQSQSQNAKEALLHRSAIKEYEITFDRQRLIANNRKLLYAALIPISLFLLLFVLWLLGGVDDRRTGPLVIVGPVALFVWIMLWRFNTAYFMSLSYSIINDVLTVTSLRGATRIPLARITDVKTLTLKNFEQISVQTAGSPWPEAHLWAVSDPEAVVAMLLSKQS